MTAQEEIAVSSPIGKTWSVWRQDDYGNRFEVRQGLSQADALRLVAEFEARGHKQSYWAEPGSTQGPQSR
jgi:UDP-N-acetyl-2-amino-2-deoxyglucuronate dehydrogenase